MKTIMIDMDDVITYGNFSKILENFLGYKPDYNSFKGYYLQDMLGERKKDFFEYFKDINMYKDSELLPDCYEVIKKLSEKYKIYICTDYVWREIPEYAGNNLKNKYEFLYEKFDFLKPENFIFAKDKTIVNCDIKIDDRLENLSGASTKLLFNAYHNKNYSEDFLQEENVTRVCDWKEIENLLLKDYCNI